MITSGAPFIGLPLLLLCNEVTAPHHLGVLLVIPAAVLECLGRLWICHSLGAT
ncbi:hypothetical protein ACFVQB_23585 [Paenibacillus sp. NPDC057886]|uniref:hypothetical protein n=1 Tax=Paenibacillus sp. NPDC057886 TaxID=3346270 RepID=UPI0036ACD32F